MVYVIVSVVTVLCMVVGFVYYKMHKANKEIDRLFKQNEQLQKEKALAQTQIKHFGTRKKNEENSRNADRNSLISSLQQQDDLRD